MGRAYRRLMSLRLRAGVSPEVVEKEVTTTSARMARPLAHFVKAYLTARQLPKLVGRVHAQAVEARRSYLAWFEIYLALGANPPAEVRGALLLPAQP